MKSPVQLNRKQSRIFLMVYIFATLAFRFYFEPMMGENYIASILIGLFLLAIIWAMIKIQFLNFAEKPDSSSQDGTPAV